MTRLADDGALSQEVTEETFQETWFCAGSCTVIIGTNKSPCAARSSLPEGAGFKGLIRKPRLGSE